MNFQTLSLGEEIETANRQTVDRMLSARPALVDIATAIDVLPGMHENSVFHAGPPISWERMCDPMRRAIRGALVFEGRARDEGEAQRLIEAGEVHLSPNHWHSAVGPMTGVISPSMPVLVVRDEVWGRVAYSTFNEGGRQGLWLGAPGPDALVRLQWIRDVLAPVFKTILEKTGPLSIPAYLAQGLQMGDECHNRHAACTSLLFRTIGVALLESELERSLTIPVAKFLVQNSHFFLNLTMAACKAVADAAHGISQSTIVTAMTRNGTDFAIRVGGMGERWFLAPSPLLEEALYYPGYSVEDGAPDIGDSSIIETLGLGGFAIAASPAMASLAGGTLKDAIRWTEEMAAITVARNPQYAIPALDSVGVPLGIDVRKVVETGILPLINSAIVHKTSGVGQIGVGMVRAPHQCFAQALEALADELPVTEGALG